MKQINAIAWAAGGLLLAVLAVLMGTAGCESSGTPSDVIVQLKANFTGTYRHADGSSPIVEGNSGPRINRFYVNQTGNLVTFTDNHNMVYSGSLATPVTIEGSPTTAQFVVEGRSASGAQVTIQGTFKNAGDINLMNGQWLEASGNKGVVAARALAIAKTTTVATTSTRTTSSRTSTFIVTP